METQAHKAADMNREINLNLAMEKSNTKFTSAGNDSLILCCGYHYTTRIQGDENNILILQTETL